MLFISLTLFSVFLLYRRTLFDTRWFLKILLFVIPLPLIACQLGWIVAEVGRQPWVVYGLLKTKDAFSTNITSGEVIFSIIIFGMIYLLLGASYIFFLSKIVKQGPAVIQERGNK